MAIDLVDVGAVVLKLSDVTGLTEATAKGRAAATDEVRAHAVTCIADAYELHQVRGITQLGPTVLGNTQDPHMDSIPGSAEIAGNPTDLVGTGMTQLDTINARYRQTLSTFSTVINGITRVCHPN